MLPFEADADVKKLPWQIYSKLPKVPFKHSNSKKYVIEFHSQPFEDLSCMLCELAGACNREAYAVSFCYRSDVLPVL